MAQIPQQQVQVYQSALPSQFQPVYLPQSQYLTLQSSPYRTPVVQNIAPAQAVNLQIQPKSTIDFKTLGQNAQRSAILLQSQSYAQSSNGALQRQVPVQSRIMTAQDLNNMCGQAQILGPYTLSSLQSGYSWINPSQHQSNIFRTNQHPGIYVQSSTQPTIQLPIPTVQQDMTATSYIVGSQVCQETQTIATQTGILNGENCDSNAAPLPNKVDSNNEITIKPTGVCSSTVANVDAPPPKPMLPTILPAPETIENCTDLKARPESPMQMETDSYLCKSSMLQNEPASEPVQEFPLLPTEETLTQPNKDPTVSDAVPNSGEVSSTTAVENVDNESPELYSYAIVPFSPPTPQLDELSDYDLNSSRSASEVEQTNGNSSPHFNPVIKLKRLKPQDLLGTTKDKQLQRAIVKPQIVPHNNVNGIQNKSESFQEPFPNSSNSEMSKKEVILQKRRCSSSSGSSSSENKESTHSHSGFNTRKRGRLHKRKRFYKKKKSLQSQPTLVQTTSLSEETNNFKPDNISPPDQQTISLVINPSEGECDATLPSDISTDIRDDQTKMEDSEKLLTNWSVQEVFIFLKSSAICSTYADTFKSEEIDGHALSLLKLDHLMTGMSMKLGHAVKLLSDIDTLKKQQECSQVSIAV